MTITDAMIEAGARGLCRLRIEHNHRFDKEPRDEAFKKRCEDAAWQDFVVEAKAALVAAERAAWRPIEEAPRIPDQRLDLWVVPGKPMWGERGKPYREANARLSGNGKHWIGADGRYIEGLRTYDSFDPNDRSPDATIVTHFRPLPTPGEPDER